MRIIATSLVVIGALVGPCSSAVTEYNNNKSAWIAAAGPYTQIGFTGHPDGTLITTQYSSVGVTFTDGIDLIAISRNLFPNDGAGLRGAFDEIAVAFDQPMHVVAVDHPGTVQFRLYWQGQLTYTSSIFLHGGVGFFAGLISDQPFDAAVILDPLGGVVIDDLYFGPPIPAAPGLALLVLGSLAARRRRRERS